MRACCEHLRLGRLEHSYLCYYVRVRIAVLLQICATTRSFGCVAREMQTHSPWCMEQAATICVQMLRVISVSKPCIFFSGGDHTLGTFGAQLQDGNLQLYSYLALKTLCKHVSPPLSVILISGAQTANKVLHTAK